MSHLRHRFDRARSGKRAAGSPRVYVRPQKDAPRVAWPWTECVTGGGSCRDSQGEEDSRIPCALFSPLLINSAPHGQQQTR